MKKHHIISIFVGICFILISCSSNGLPNRSDQVTQNPNTPPGTSTPSGTNTPPDTSGQSGTSTPSGTNTPPSTNMQSGTSVEPDPNMGPRAYIGLVVTGDSKLLRTERLYYASGSSSSWYTGLHDNLVLWDAYYPRLAFHFNVSRQWISSSDVSPLVGAAVYDDQRNAIIWQLTPHDYEIFYTSRGGNINYRFEFYALNQPQRLFVKSRIDVSRADAFFNPFRNTATKLAGEMRVGTETPTYSSSKVLYVQTAKLTSTSSSLFAGPDATYPLALKDPDSQTISVGDVYGPTNPDDRIVFEHMPSDSSTPYPLVEYTFEIHIVEGYEIWPGTIRFELRSGVFSSATTEISGSNDYGHHAPPPGYAVYPYTYTIPLHVTREGPFRAAFSGSRALDVQIRGTYGRAHGEFVIADPSLDGRFVWGNLEKEATITSTVNDVVRDTRARSTGIQIVDLDWPTGAHMWPDNPTIHDVFGEHGYPMELPTDIRDLGRNIYRSTDPNVHIEYNLGSRDIHPSFPYLPFIFDIEIRR